MGFTNMCVHCGSSEVLAGLLSSKSIVVFLYGIKRGGI